jgi:hypothetical protein
MNCYFLLRKYCVEKNISFSYCIFKIFWFLLSDEKNFLVVKIRSLNSLVQEVFRRCHMLTRHLLYALKNFPRDDFQNSVLGSAVGIFISWEAMSSLVHFRRYISLLFARTTCVASLIYHYAMCHSLTFQVLKVMDIEFCRNVWKQFYSEVSMPKIEKSFFNRFTCLLNRDTMTRY